MLFDKLRDCLYILFKCYSKIPGHWSYFCSVSRFDVFFLFILTRSWVGATIPYHRHHQHFGGDPVVFETLTIDVINCTILVDKWGGVHFFDSKSQYTKTPTKKFFVSPPHSLQRMLGCLLFSHICTLSGITRKWILFPVD